MLHRGNWSLPHHRLGPDRGKNGCVECQLRQVGQAILATWWGSADCSKVLAKSSARKAVHLSVAGNAASKVGDPASLAARRARVVTERGRAAAPNGNTPSCEAACEATSHRWLMRCIPRKATQWR